MITNFSEQLWIDFDLEIAVFLENLVAWIRFNASKDKPEERNFHEGKYWSYNSYPQFARLFPGWSTKTMRTIVKRCVKNGLLLIGNFNKKNYDNTNWYTLTEKAWSYFPLIAKKLYPASSVDDANDVSDLNTHAQTGRPPAQTGRPIPLNPNHNNNNNISSHISKNEQQKEGQKNKSESTVSTDTGIGKSSVLIPDVPESRLSNAVEDCPTPVSSDTGQSLGGKIKLDEYVKIWNRLAGEIGCPLVLNNKRQRETIKKHLKCIALRWEQPLTPHNFESWLKNSIALEYYLITKYLSRMDVCLRWHHFSESYEKMMQELKKEREDD